MKSVRITVTGVVQGVSYRASTQAEARKLGLAGFVRNQPDGSVYAEAEGPAPQVDALIAWCHQGPPRAVVTAVQVEPQNPVGYDGFSIRY